MCTLLNYYYNGDSFNKLVDALEFLILNCPIAIECSVTNMLIAPCRDQGLLIITQYQWYFHIFQKAFTSIDKIWSGNGNPSQEVSDTRDVQTNNAADNSFGQERVIHTSDQYNEF